ncbi:DGQHR domain-containing protein [Devosia rhodophyticola]|uniref:DGQHR domain-containing protein n=1 Tax=Devosia rhodophyticola TaxID=3026423 RepID=A0ABY7YV23_9HYPH|nr:DGQHR domain-containing protein [Devosia rhodophyticola]WDR05101.1 DGQHR domain-containing protein [Devosia rhodophyticola]
MTEVEFSVIEVRQPIGPFYVGQMSAQDLFSMCKFDFRRIEERGGVKEFLGIQRRLDEKRVREISTYIKTKEAVFPTAVVIALDQRNVTVKNLADGIFSFKLSAYKDLDDPSRQIEFDDIVSIIDGQHRIKAFESYNGPEFLINVSIFIDIDEATKAEIFSTVNLAQTKVNKSLVYDLFSLSLGRSPEKTCHELVVALDRLEGSPFEKELRDLEPQHLIDSEKRCRKQQWSAASSHI